MIQALAPRMPRGFSWVWLAVVAIALAPVTTQAQAPKTPPVEDKAKADEKKADEKAEKDDAGDDAPTTETFVDPNAKKALGIFSPLNYAGPTISVKLTNPPDDRNRVQSMAAKTVNTDPDFLRNYVNFFACELTRRDYLNAILNPPDKMRATAPEARGLERALDALTKPLIDARANENREFISVYSKILFDSSLTKILENNYLTRIDAMIILGMAGSADPKALDFYIKELKKPDQVIWVKLWAARGITNATQNGKIDLDASKTAQASEAVIGFLESDPKLPWPARIRGLETLGSLRLAYTSSARGKIDAASIAMKALADPEARPEVRAWGAWALGMMKIPTSLSPFNYTLVGQEIGLLAVDLGSSVVQEYDENKAKFEQEKVMAEHLTALLLFQVYPSLLGEDGVRDSGLIHSTHPNYATAKPFFSKLDDQVKAISREAYELLRAGGGAVKEKRDDLDAKVADLKKLLEQNIPKDRHLVPGGPEFAPPNGQQVAGVPGR